MERNDEALLDDVRALIKAARKRLMCEGLWIAAQTRPGEEEEMARSEMDYYGGEVDVIIARLPDDIADRLRLVGTPAPSTDDPVCGATTVVDGKFRTCELPNGHTSDHRTTLRGIEIWWPVDEPAAPVIGSNQCEHGHLARVCVTCELIAAEARIAELERENADLKRMVCAVQPSADHESLYCYDTVFRGLSMNWFEARDKMLSAGKEAPYAE